MNSTPKQERNTIVFLDSGDTIIDEGTEVRDQDGVVIDADVIPGADKMVQTLAEKGYRIALVADGLAQSFKNVLHQHGVYDCFETMIYSEPIKAEKPSRRMFKAAIGAMDLQETDIRRIVMVGNNLKKDIKGANEMGITSVFLKGSPRYPQTPADDSEIPDYIVSKPMDVVDMIEQIEQSHARTP